MTTALATHQAEPVPPAPGQRRDHAVYDLLGVPVSAISLDEAVAIFGRWIGSWNERVPTRYVCITGVHGITECQRDPEVLRIHREAAMVTPDGMPLVWLGRRAGFPHMTRVCGPDLMTEICRISPAHGWRHFLYGGEPGVAELLADRLRQRFPGIRIVGTWCPPFRPLTDAEKEDVAALIHRARPDIVWVGLSTPRQERWMAEMAPRLRVPVLVGVGAAFDFLSGRKPRAPRWMQRSGLEWLFRLATEPRRLWRRYLVNNTAFLWALARQGLPARQDRAG
jgi:N-acetylglucosaminyldiphosphoundecaprenol N-acetyl-beta-D-mannosaminyltransferase